MRYACLALAAVLVLPALAAAQDCLDCILGIWDDPALTTNRGEIVPFEPKDLYVGMKLAGGIPDFAGVEFSVFGLDRDGLSLLGATPLGPKALVFGTVPAPEDTSETSQGIGGVTCAWTSCLKGSVAIMKLVVYATADLSDHLLLVKRSYPTTNVSWHVPVLVRCDPPFYTVSRVTGGCYVLNPSSPTGDCASLQENPMAVNNKTWSGMKQLFR